MDPVFDAKSCRALGQQSCGDDPAPNTVTTIDLPRALFDMVVIMGGYDEWYETFAASFDQVVASARAKGAKRVIWLTYTEDVDYVLPDGTPANQSLVNMNQIMRDLVASGEYPDVLIADWFHYATSAVGWYAEDDVHLSRTGAYGVADFIARKVAFAAGLPCPMPREPAGPLETPCPDPDVSGPLPTSSPSTPPDLATTEDSLALILGIVGANSRRVASLGQDGRRAVAPCRPDASRVVARGGCVRIDQEPDALQCARSARANPAARQRDRVRAGTCESVLRLGGRRRGTPPWTATRGGNADPVRPVLSRALHPRLAMGRVAATAWAPGGRATDRDGSTRPRPVDRCPGWIVVTYGLYLLNGNALVYFLQPILRTLGTAVLFGCSVVAGKPDRPVRRRLLLVRRHRSWSTAGDRGLFRRLTYLGPVPRRRSPAST